MSLRPRWTCAEGRREGSAMPPKRVSVAFANRRASPRWPRLRAVHWSDAPRRRRPCDHVSGAIDRAEPRQRGSSADHMLLRRRCVGRARACRLPRSARAAVRMRLAYDWRIASVTYPCTTAVPAPAADEVRRSWLCVAERMNPTGRCEARRRGLREREGAAPRNMFLYARGSRRRRQLSTAVSVPSEITPSAPTGRSSGRSW